MLNYLLFVMAFRYSRKHKIKKKNIKEEEH